MDVVSVVELAGIRVLREARLRRRAALLAGLADALGQFALGRAALDAFGLAHIAGRPLKRDFLGKREDRRPANGERVRAWVPRLSARVRKDVGPERRWLRTLFGLG